MRMTPCQNCGKDIVWGITKDAKQIPFDLIVMDSGLPSEFVVYALHSATCSHKSEKQEKTKEVMHLGKSKRGPPPGGKKKA